MPYTPEVTKANIFDAAVEEFSDHGFAGARVARIAERAGENKQAIYLYFGDKASLFAEVLERLLGELAAIIGGPGDPVAYVTGLFDYFREHPRHLRLLMWEALEFGDGQVPGEDHRTPHYRRRVEDLRSAQANGQVADVAPEHLWTALAAMPCWYLAACQLTRMGFGHPPTPADDDREREILSECARRLTAP